MTLSFKHVQGSSLPHASASVMDYIVAYLYWLFFIVAVATSLCDWWVTALKMCDPILTLWGHLLVTAIKIYDV